MIKHFLSFEKQISDLEGKIEELRHLSSGGDINIAEPDARAGFAGPNIIEQTIRQKLPKGFQRSEFLLEHGAIDMIVHRNDMRETLARVLAKLTNLSAPGQPAPVLEGEVIEADGGAA